MEDTYIGGIRMSKLYYSDSPMYALILGDDNKVHEMWRLGLYDGKLTPCNKCRILTSCPVRYGALSNCILSMMTGWGYKSRYNPIVNMVIKPSIFTVSFIRRTCKGFNLVMGK